MLHFFFTDYFLRNDSYQKYEMFSYELSKWAEYYLSQKTGFHQSNWCAGRVTENPNDILLGHPTWDDASMVQELGLGKMLRDWVKDNALSPHDAAHPNTYIIMPWVPEFPMEWQPNLVHIDSQLLAAKKIFAICGQIWIDRTHNKQDNSIQSRVKDKLIRSNIGIPIDNFPIVKTKFNPIGQRQLLHISTLGTYKGFENTCESIQGLPTQLNVASKSLQATTGIINVNINGKKYSFNFLGAINNADPEFNHWVVNACDFYIHTGTMDAQATVILENAARGLIPLVTPESGFECPHAIYLTHDPNKNREIIRQALAMPESELIVRSQLLREFIQKEHSWENIFEKIWNEIQTDIQSRQVSKNQYFHFAKGDYVSPNLSVIFPDRSFPNMIRGNTNDCNWSYLRREIPHNWYVDRHQPAAGFVSRDEAHILYNSALQFAGKSALEIGCWMGWSACHLALAGVDLDVIDPLLDNPVIRDSVTNSLRSAGVINRVNLIAGYSPAKVSEIFSSQTKKWALIFIDGDHSFPAPFEDAKICEQYAADDALILFHDLACPDVAQGLDYLKARGWQTMIYQTMQIMGVAWRGNAIPVSHIPDPLVNWHLPAHLQHYSVSGLPDHPDLQEFQEILPIIAPFTILSESRLFSLFTESKRLCIEGIEGNFVECGVFRGSASAMLAWVIKKYSQSDRLVYAFDTYAGMPEPTDHDRHREVPANDTGFGVGTLVAPMDEYLLVICDRLGVTDLVVPVQGLFGDTLPIYAPEIGKVTLLHANGDWYQSTLDIFNNLYDRVVLNGVIQIDDFGHWQGCRKAIEEFLDQRPESDEFIFESLDYTGIRFCKSSLSSHEPSNQNYVTIFPQWDDFEESLYDDLTNALLALLAVPASDRPIIFIAAWDTDAERADAILSEVVMGLLLTKDIDLSSEPNIILTTDPKQIPPNACEHRLS